MLVFPKSGRSFFQGLCVWLQYIFTAVEGEARKDAWQLDVEVVTDILDDLHKVRRSVIYRHFTRF